MIEVDILTVSSSEERADDIFEYIFIKADLYHRSNGFTYQCGLSEATTFQLPEIPKEELFSGSTYIKRSLHFALFY